MFYSGKMDTAMLKVIASISVFIIFTVIGSLFSGCNDGWLSASIGSRGACSHHGGVSGMPGLFMFVGFVAGVFLFLKLSSKNSIHHDDSNAIDTSIRNVENVNSRGLIKTTIKNDEKKELIASFEKYSEKNKNPLLKVFVYSNGLLLCELINKNDGYDCFIRKLNMTRMNDLQTTLENVFLHDGNEFLTGVNLRYFKLRFFSDNARRHSEIVIGNFNEPKLLRLKNIIIDAFPVVARKM